MYTLPVLIAALFLHVKFPLLPGLRDTLYGIIVLSACSAIFYPPDTRDFIRYTNAFLSTSFVIRAVELLLVQDLSHLKRLQRVSYLSSSPVYTWEPISPTLGWKRFVQVCDLIINPRAVGWSYGSPKYQPPVRKLEAASAPDGANGCVPKREDIVLVAGDDRFTFLIGKLCRALVAYFIIDSYQTAIGRNYSSVSNFVETFLTNVLGIQASPVKTEGVIRLFVLPPVHWMASYAFVDGIHAATGVFSVGVLRIISPQLAAEPWMYPPVFGAIRYMFTFSLRGKSPNPPSYSSKGNSLTKEKSRHLGQNVARSLPSAIPGPFPLPCTRSMPLRPQTAPHRLPLLHGIWHRPRSRDLRRLEGLVRRVHDDVLLLRPANLCGRAANHLRSDLAACPSREKYYLSGCYLARKCGIRGSVGLLY